MTAPLVANIVAGLSLLVSAALAFFYIRDRRHAKIALEISHANRLMEWHGAVIEVLLFLKLTWNQSSGEKHREHLARLSGLIDQGRFFFPNLDRGDGYGASKPPAFRGYRNLALDFLVGSFNLFSKPPTSEAEADVDSLRRHFTSILFEVLCPRERLARIRSLTDRYFIKDVCYQQFLDHPDGAIIDSIWRR